MEWKNVLSVNGPSETWHFVALIQRLPRPNDFVICVKDVGIRIIASLLCLDIFCTNGCTLSLSDTYYTGIFHS